MYVMNQCGAGATPKDIKDVLDRTCKGKISSQQWYYSSFEDGLNALKQLGWTLEHELKNEEANEAFHNNGQCIEALCSYILPRQDHFIYWQFSKWYNGTYKEWIDFCEKKWKREYEEMKKKRNEEIKTSSLN